MELRITQANLQKALRRQATLQKQVEEQRLAFEKLVEELANQTEKVKQCEGQQKEAPEKVKDFMVKDFMVQEQVSEQRTLAPAAGLEFWGEGSGLGGTNSEAGAQLFPPPPPHPKTKHHARRKKQKVQKKPSHAKRQENENV